MILSEILEKANLIYRNRKQTMASLELGLGRGRKQGLNAKEHKGAFWSEEKSSLYLVTPQQT